MAKRNRPRSNIVEFEQNDVEAGRVFQSHMPAKYKSAVCLRLPEGVNLGGKEIGGCYVLAERKCVSLQDDGTARLRLVPGDIRVVRPPTDGDEPVTEISPVTGNAISRSQLRVKTVSQRALYNALKHKKHEAVSEDTSLDEADSSPKRTKYKVVRRRKAKPAHDEGEDVAKTPTESDEASSTPGPDDSAPDIPKAEAPKPIEHEPVEHTAESQPTQGVSVRYGIDDLERMLDKNTTAELLVPANGLLDGSAIKTAFEREAGSSLP